VTRLTTLHKISVSNLEQLSNPEQHAHPGLPIAFIGLLKNLYLYWHDPRHCVIYFLYFVNKDGTITFRANRPLSFKSGYKSILFVL